MPKLKKINKSGRPKGTYAQLDEKEMIIYHHNVVKKYCEPKQVKTPKQTPLQTVGRTPRNETPMTPNTLKARKCELGAAKYKRNKISKERKRAVQMRWSLENADKEKPGSSNDNEEVEDSCNENEIENSDRSETRNEFEKDEVCFDEIIDANDNTFDGTDAEYYLEDISQATFYRYAARLVAMFQKNPIDNLKIFVSCLHNFNRLELEVPKISNLSYMGTLTVRQLKYQKLRLVDSVLKHFKSKPSQTKLFLYWIENVFEDRLNEYLIMRNWTLPAELMPKSVRVSNLAADIGQRFLKRHNTAEPQQIQGISYVVAVARETNLSINHCR